MPEDDIDSWPAIAQQILLLAIIMLIGLAAGLSIGAGLSDTGVGDLLGGS